MKMKCLMAGIVTVLGAGGIDAQAAMLNAGDLLTISAGVYDIDTGFVVAGSWVGADSNGDGTVSSPETAPAYPGTDGGIIMGVTQLPGEIDYWGDWFGHYGQDYTTVAPTGGTTAGIDFSGWMTIWGPVPALNMGGGAWGAGYSNGVANFSWSGIYGDAYSLDYHATVPFNDPSGFGGVRFAWHLEGIVQSAVPVPATAWLFGSGLLGLFSSVRRRWSI